MKTTFIVIFIVGWLFIALQVWCIEEFTKGAALAFSVVWGVMWAVFCWAGYWAVRSHK